MVDWYRSELELIGGIRCIASGDCHHVLNLMVGLITALTRWAGMLHYSSFTYLCEEETLIKTVRLSPHLAFSMLIHSLSRAIRSGR